MTIFGGSRRLGNTVTVLASAEDATAPWTIPGCNEQDALPADVTHGAVDLASKVLGER